MGTPVLKTPQLKEHQVLIGMLDAAHLPCQTHYFPAVKEAVAAGDKER